MRGLFYYVSGDYFFFIGSCESFEIKLSRLFYVIEVFLLDGVKFCYFLEVLEGKDYSGYVIRFLGFIILGIIVWLRFIVFAVYFRGIRV